MGGDGERKVPCKWCKTEINAAATRCPTCQMWQGDKGPYGPKTLVIASVITVFLTPLTLSLATLWYQQSTRAQDAARTRLEQTFKEVKAIVDMLGEWQANYNGLLRELNASDDALKDLTKQLCTDKCYEKVQRDYPEAAETCAAK